MSRSNGQWHELKGISSWLQLLVEAHQMRGNSDTGLKLAILAADNEIDSCDSSASSITVLDPTDPPAAVRICFPPSGSSSPFFFRVRVKQRGLNAHLNLLIPQTIEPLLSLVNLWVGLPKW